ncbi:hypothetical protein [Terribacillus saccharophilus]|uniref:hypothetical protein n=1 Tax=Terribacillus saccharophilus TaxID=361277 RepID=UPI001595B048|nr:hypothetical protein [Terribacillus saccharophilus]
MQEQNQDFVPYHTDEQVQYSYPVYTDEYRRRPGYGFGGFGRPGFGYGRPGFGYGGGPFLGGVVGGLIGSSLLYPPYYNRPRPYPYYPYPYPYYNYPYYGYGYGY